MATATVKVLVALPADIYTILEPLAQKRELSPWLVEAARQRIEREEPSA